jgi:uncharacterized membrane protein
MSSKDLPARAEDRSLKNLVSDLKENSSLLVRQEIALAKAEVKEKIKGVAKQAITFSIAGVLAYTGILVVLAALILAVIALGVVAWLAALIVGAAVLGGAFLFVQRARRPAKEST